jgi:2-dehydropantoate 2-reductase
MSRILIYGAGAIGCTFAGKLLASGADVTLLARGDWKDTLERDGLVLEDCLNRRQLRLRPRLITDLAPADRYDYILVVMQATQVAAVLPVLAANCSPAVVFVVNNPLGYDAWAAALGAGRIMLGFPSAGGERRDGKVAYFIGTGLAKAFQSTTFGELDGSASPRLKTLAGIFRTAGFAPTTCADMASWQKCHVAVILPISRALCRFGSDNYRLARSWPTIGLMVLATRECFAVLKAGGVPVTPGKLRFYCLPRWILVPVFALVLGTRMAEFAMAKHTVVAKDELRLLEEQFRGFISASGIPTPAFDRLCQAGAEAPPAD